MEHFAIFSLVAAAVLILIAIPYPVSGQKCKFNGPTDSSTLRGRNFISNYGTGNCLKINRIGLSRLPINLDVCSWNNFYPLIEQTFEVRNHNSGSILLPNYDSRNERCIGTYGGNLVATDCIPKSNDQTWIFNHVKEGIYQILKRSNGRCLRAQSKVKRSNVIETICNPGDHLQLWRICTKL